MASKGVFLRICAWQSVHSSAVWGQRRTNGESTPRGGGYAFFRINDRKWPSFLATLLTILRQVWDILCKVRANYCARAEGATSTFSGASTSVPGALSFSFRVSTSALPSSWVTNLSSY